MPNITVCIIEDNAFALKGIIQSLEEAMKERATDSKDVASELSLTYAHIWVNYKEKFDLENLKRTQEESCGVLNSYNEGKFISDEASFFPILVKQATSEQEYETLKDEAFGCIHEIINQFGKRCVILLDLCLFLDFEESLLRKGGKTEILSMKIYHQFRERCILYSSYAAVAIGPDWERAYQAFYDLEKDPPPRIYNRAWISQGKAARNTERVKQLLNKIVRYAGIAE